MIVSFNRNDPGDTAVHTDWRNHGFNGFNLPDRALHFKVNKAFEFDRVFHRKLADEVVDEAVDGE
jgi:hypothetical protein